MAYTRLTDIVPVKTFTALVEAKLTENSKFRQSGIVGTDPRVTAKAQSAGLEVTLREWKRVTGGGSTNASDDASSKFTPRKAEQQAMLARVLQRTDGFAAMEAADFASDSDAIAFAVSELLKLRVDDEQETVLAILTGLMADNAANDSGDMIKDTALGTGSITAANLLNQGTLINARATMGDMGGDLKTLIMHSDVCNYLRKQENSAYKQASETTIGMDTYLGYKVVETDFAGAKSGSGTYAKYTTFLAGSDLLAYAPVAHPKAVVQVSDEFAGDGSGQETVINRWRYIMHPTGFSNAAAPTNGFSQSKAELEAAATWNRVHARKAIPLVKIVTNIA